MIEVSEMKGVSEAEVHPETMESGFIWGAE